MKKYKHLLVENGRDLKMFRHFQEVIFCAILVFNKRRVGELQRIVLASFLKNYKNEAPLSEFENALSESEKILYKSFRRVVIKGKRGRGVPVLFTRDMIESLDFLISLRKNFNLDNNPYLFGVPDTVNPLAGNLIMRKHAKLAFGDGNRASLLTSTKIRKHLATIAQILKMERNDLEQLANFLGHTEKTHSEFYRLPDNIYQTAKVSKILLLSKSRSIEKYKGKSLKDIEVDETLEEDSDCANKDEDTFDSDEQSDNDQQDIPSSHHVEKTLRTAARKFIKRVPWTDEQKKIAKDYFHEHIKKKTAAKKDEVIDFINKYPEVYKNKSWQVIKAFVQNIYSKKLKAI